MSSLAIASLSLASLFTATISGFIGLAGGSILLGILLATGMDVKLAIPIHALVQLFSNGSRTLAQLPHVRWRDVGLLVLTALPGPFLGLWLLNRLDAPWIKGTIALVILYSAWAPKWGVAQLSDRAAFMIAGALGGSFGLVLGAVGPMLGPFFLRPSYERREVIATQAVCQVYLHILKIIVFSTIGFHVLDHLALLIPMGFTTIAGTALGTWMLGKMSDRLFVILYKTALSLLALQLLVSVIMSR